jgi:hypothetical protein
LADAPKTGIEKAITALQATVAAFAGLPASCDSNLIGRNA